VELLNFLILVFLFLSSDLYEPWELDKLLEESIARKKREEKEGDEK
jgi:hypothetical protein